MERKIPDIVGLVGMLKCIAAFNQLPAGDSLSFTIRDEDVNTALVKIMGNDAGCRMVLEETPEGHRMMVTKT